MRELLPVLGALVVTTYADPGTTYNVLNECPSRNPVGQAVHIPHEYDCSKFYKCMDGAPHLYSCPKYRGGRSRLRYNPDKQICDWPWNVKCTLPSPECPSANVDQDTKIPHPDDCSLYYRCKNGKLAEKCPDGSRFDSTSMTCTSKEDASCYVRGYVCPPSSFNLEVRLPHNRSCEEYYECVDEETIVAKRCPVGEAFDADLRRCVRAEQASCDPALSQSPSNGCPLTGVHRIPHETDCSLYYECRDGVRTQKQCQDGLSFDPVKNMCTWSMSVECASNPSMTSSTVSLPTETPTNTDCPPRGSNKAMRLPHDCSCSKYYECVDGEKIIQSCENGTEFDYVRQVCDRPSHARCKNRDPEFVVETDTECPPSGEKNIPHETDCSYYYSCSDGTKTLKKCLQGHYFNPVVEACDLVPSDSCHGTVPSTTTPRDAEPDECPVCECGHCVTRYPNKFNCSLYYECENGVKNVKPCPEGLLYNPVEQICDWPRNVNCTPSVPRCKVGEKAPHECNCGRYYRCVEEGWALQECPDGQHFDYEKLYCGPPNEVNCRPSSSDDGCVAECSSIPGQTLPHRDCDKYCECRDGMARVVHCIENMYYNPDRQACDWPENVLKLSCDPFPCHANASGTKLPHECGCDHYYVCNKGLMLRGNCSDGLEFNYETGKCERPEMGHCYRKPTTEHDIETLYCVGKCPNLNASDRSVTLPHRDCTKFCRCGAGAPYVVSCPTGLHYSETEKICTDPSSARCSVFGVEPRDSTKGSRKRSFWQSVLPFNV